MQRAIVLATMFGGRGGRHPDVASPSRSGRGAGAATVGGGPNVRRGRVSIPRAAAATQRFAAAAGRIAKGRLSARTRARAPSTVGAHGRCAAYSQVRRAYERASSPSPGRCSPAGQWAARPRRCRCGWRPAGAQRPGAAQGRAAAPRTLAAATGRWLWRTRVAAARVGGRGTRVETARAARGPAAAPWGSGAGAVRERAVGGGREAGRGRADGRARPASGGRAYAAGVAAPGRAAGEAAGARRPGVGGVPRGGRGARGIACPRPGVGRAPAARPRRRFDPPVGRGRAAPGRRRHGGVTGTPEPARGGASADAGRADGDIVAGAPAARQRSPERRPPRARCRGARAGRAPGGLPAAAPGRTVYYPQV